MSPRQIEELVAFARVKPLYVQNRCYARTGWDAEVRALCREQGIVYQGFSLLTANRRELATATVQRIAARARRTVPQVIFRFALQVGMAPLTGSSDPTHLGQDLAAFDFELGADEIATIERVAAD